MNDTPSSYRERTIARRLSGVPRRYQKQYLKVLKDKASPRTAIKMMCLECVGWTKSEVVACTATACPLYRFRPTASRPTDALSEAHQVARSATS